MKKQASLKPGQKRLTQFFTIKSSNGPQGSSGSIVSNTNELDEDKCREQKKSLSSQNEKTENVSKDHQGGCLKDHKISNGCQTGKWTQKSIYNFSPTKENVLQEESYALPASEKQVVLNEKKVSSKRSPSKKSPLKKSPSKKKHETKSPQKAVQSTILTFSPEKKLVIVSTKSSFYNSDKTSSPKKKDLLLNDDRNANTSSKKRKYNTCPLKEKENDLSSAPSEINKNGDHSTSSENISSVWRDDLDFVNLSDSIIISPQKIQIKKRKCSTTDVSSDIKCSLNFDTITSSYKTKNFLEQDLSSYFLTDFTIDEKKEISFDKLNRYEIINISRMGEDTKLTLKNVSDEATGVCIVKSPWNEYNLSVNDIVSVRGTKRDEGWVVDWNGLLVINPDRLLSGTAIVQSVFCIRKCVLSHIFKEPGTKDCMVVGTFLHEIFQEVLKERLLSMEEIEVVYQNLIRNRNFLLKLFHTNINYEETISTIHSYVPHIHKFMQQYVLGEPEKIQSENWKGQIVEAEDIEENIWSPVLGMKGKVDATVEVQLNKKHKIMPLELKTGKVSFSIEHRGQVILYCMLLQEMGRNVDSGLLLYLNSGVDMKEIKCEERETRDLTLLRNGLLHWLTKMSKVEPNEVIKSPTLPPPVNRRSCSSCPYLVPCSASLSKEGFENLSDNHHLKQYGPEAIKHLSDSQIDFIFHWLGLLLLEKSSSTSSMSGIWSVDSDLREKSGKCLAWLRMDDCAKNSDGGFKALLSKIDGSLLETEFTAGQLLVLSTEKHFAHALGVVQTLSPISITVLLDKYFKTEKPIFLDAYEGDSTFTILTNNLSCLFENTSQAALLRELIIDLKVPTFSSKLSSKIKKIGEDIFGRLNREQVRAVLQAISADNYILIKGMPGTGKTTTMAALIELLTRLKKRVLVTSFTHSALDNILIHVVGKVKMLRLGPEHRIHPKLKSVSEQYFIKNLEKVTPASVEEVFKNKEVVGVTCFGSKHPWVERQMFDVCLIDEATQVPLPAILKPISVSKKFILIGDPKQLPPLVLNKKAKDLGLGMSLFGRLERPAVTSPLTLQYRMNGVITSLANDFVYNGVLQCGNDNVKEASLSLPKGVHESEPLWLKTALSTDILKSVIILDVKGEITTDGENRAEADVVKKIVEALIKGGIMEESIGIISTYNRQVALLKCQLADNVEVNTVDQYQGRDKEIIIYSTSRTSVSAERNDILSDWNRLTVGITRAKRKLIIVGNLDVLKEYSNFKKLIQAVSVDNIMKAS